MSKLTQFFHQKTEQLHGVCLGSQGSGSTNPKRNHQFDAAKLKFNYLALKVSLSLLDFVCTVQLW